MKNRTISLARYAGVKRKLILKSRLKRALLLCYGEDSNESDDFVADFRWWNSRDMRVVNDFCKSYNC
jgi:hypothetical protein